MNETRRPLAIYLVIIVILLIAGGVFLSFRSNNQKAAYTPPTDESCKKEDQKTYEVYIQYDVVSQGNIQAKQCDKLVVVNLDDVEREIAFGPHDSHVEYDGITEVKLAKNESLTVTLIQTGTFRVHDHDDSRVATIFTVTAR